jgi:hypothetical protein
MGARRRLVPELATAHTQGVGCPAAITTYRAEAPTDHGWVDDQCGVLSCIAGDLHTASTIVACPYYLRRDVLIELSPQPGPGGRQTQPRR